MTETLEAPVAVDPATDNFLSVRELINTLLDLDMNKTLVLSYAQANEMAYGTSAYREAFNSLHIGTVDERSSFRNEGLVWEFRMGYDNLVNKRNYYESFENAKQLRGYVTVRELINRLISLDPDDFIIIRGNFYDLGMYVGKVVTVGSRTVRVINDNKLWLM